MVASVAVHIEGVAAQEGPHTQRLHSRIQPAVAVAAVAAAVTVAVEAPAVAAPVAAEAAVAVAAGSAEAAVHTLAASSFP